MATQTAQPSEYRGHVANGVVVFDEHARPPEGAQVRVIPSAQTAPASEPIGRKLLSLAGTVKGKPPDWAEHHDHYIHGTPKRGT